MALTRRQTLVYGVGTAAFAALPFAASGRALDHILEFTGGVEPALSNDFDLILPEIAENGFAVPITVAAPGAQDIMVVAPENPLPVVAVFSFGTGLATPKATTRIRLARSQTVLAVARRADGQFIQTSGPVRVTLGGCGPVGGDHGG